MRKSKTGIILQARIGSTRLPGKVLKPMAGKPMLQWIIERLKQSKLSDMLILATSTLDQDQNIADLALSVGISVFRGSEADVLDRYYKCARENKLGVIVRATGDNPFVDAQACDQLIDFFFTNQLDYASVSTDGNHGFPVGVGVEVIGFSALEESFFKGHEAHHREHVNEYILENPERFKQDNMDAPPELRAPGLSLTVDTYEQFSFSEKIYSAYQEKFNDQLIPTAWAVNYCGKLGK